MKDGKVAKVLAHKKRKVAPKKDVKPARKKVVLVGTYKTRQLESWPGYYNYPLFKGDDDNEASWQQVNELWLFKGETEGRYFAAECLGVKTRGELKKFGYKAKGEGRSDRYVLFKIAKTYAPAKTSAALAATVEKVIVRIKDFKTAPKVQRQLKAYLESPDRKDSALAKQLPTILVKVPCDILRVCEAAVQLEMFTWDMITPVIMPERQGYTAVELFAGAGGLSIGLEQAGINVVIANEIMHDFAATLKANHPHTNVINDDIHKIDFHSELAKLGLGSVDVLSGGPPCQGFSTIGSKNRKDPRNSLFYEYLRAVAETHPKYTIFENVSGFKRMYDGFAYETLKKELDALGYDTVDGILNAADYGAPQIRYLFAA